MRRLPPLLALILITATSAFSQTQINPATQIEWSAVTGTTAPGAALGCGNSTTGNLTAGSATVTVSSTAGILLDQMVAGAGIPGSTTVTAIDTGTNSITLSQNATASETGVPLSFYAVGMPYTDTVHGNYYTCGSAGWVIVTGLTINVTNLDARTAAGCANNADPTGTSDSYCAVNAAESYRETLSYQGEHPCLYFPPGHYIVDGSLRIPSDACMIGDSPHSVIVQETNPTASLLILTQADTSDPFWSQGGYIANLTLAGNGHLTTGTLLANYGSPPTLFNVDFYNTAGRGLAGWEGAERSNYWLVAE